MNRNRHITIARNTVFLYVRTVLALLISLYTSRVVLEALGASDFGIFNLVGGFLVFFSFLNVSAGNATQRFLSVEIGQGSAGIRLVFGASLRIHIIIACVVLVLAETAGLWFVNNGLEIASDKMQSANFAYQAATVAAIASIIEIPYIAAVMASERMGAYSVISLVHMLLKLSIAMLLAHISYTDSLRVYSLLYAGMSVAVMLIWVAFAFKKLEFTRTWPVASKEYTGRLLRFLGWDSFAHFSGAARVQGIAVIINRFGGTIMNAATAISMQVYAAMIQLGEAVTLAFRPQIIEHYASGDYSGANKLLGNCARYSFLPVVAVVVPLITDIDYVLELWLGVVPPHTATFCRLTMIAALMQLLTLTASVALQAMGDIRVSSLAEGAILLSELPIAVAILKISSRPELVFALHPLALLLLLGIRVGLMQRLVPSFEVVSFIKRDVIRPMTIGLAAYMLSYPLLSFSAGIWRFLAITAMSFATTGILTYIFVLDRNARSTLRNIILS